MAQFDLYRLSASEGLIVDCQSDLLRDLPTRLVLPLLPDAGTEPLLSRLNPVLSVHGVRYVLMAHLPAALPRGLLRVPVGSAREHRLEITSAIDVLVGGV